jgi:hypothetical protein
MQNGMHFLDNHEPSFWLRGRTLDIGNRWETRQIHQCGHLRTGWVGTIALWDSRIIVCPHCTPQLMLTGDDDRRCDRCAAVGSTVHPCMVSPAPWLLIAFGLCSPCHEREAL